jgi:tetratricopeptide (TPR) repeat protein
MPTEKKVTAIIDAAEGAVIRLAASHAAATKLALVRLEMLRDIAAAHGVSLSPGQVTHLVDHLTALISGRTMTEALARKIPLVGTLVDALAEARTTHEIGWAAHEQFSTGERPPPVDAEADEAAMRTSGDWASKIPSATLADGRPNPLLVSQYDGPTWAGLDELEKRLAEDPANDELWALKAFVFYTANQWDKAIDTYRKGLEVNRQNPTLHYYLGNALFRRARFEEARQEWDAVAELDPVGKLGKNARRRSMAIRKMQK